MENNQRQRILRAVVEVASGTGYGGFTVREVIEHAGVSRRTFYEHFENKEQAFLAAYELVVSRLAVEVSASATQGGSWCQRIGLGLATSLTDSLATRRLLISASWTSCLRGLPHWPSGRAR